MRHLGNIPIIDLRKSVIDEKKSKPDQDEYVFKKKVVIDPRGIVRNPDYKIKWGSLIRGGQDLSQMRFAFGYDFVTPEDKIWPEGVKRNSDGHYQFGDAVLMKCPLRTYIEKIKEDRQAVENQLASGRARFKDATKEAGAQVSDDEIADILGL